MRLVDADTWEPYFYDHCDDVGMIGAKNALDEMPTIDAVPIVRCKDCKYASPNGEYGCKAYHFKLYETHEMKANDFCSRAERRDDAKTD